MYFCSIKKKKKKKKGNVMDKNFEIDEKDYHIRTRFLRSCSNIIIYTCTTVYFLQLLFPFSFFLFFFSSSFFPFILAAARSFTFFIIHVTVQHISSGDRERQKQGRGGQFRLLRSLLPLYIPHTQIFFFLFFC